LARLPTQHSRHEELSQKLYQIKAGYSGELDVDRVLNEVDFPQDIIIIKDLTVEILPSFYVQFDTLIFTPKRLILLEIKKYAGTVLFDEASGKTTKISLNGKIEKFDCIIHQLDRAAHGLKKWLEKRHINLPIEAILVMANQRTEIPEMPKEVVLKFIKQLPRYIRTLPDIPDALSPQQLRQVANRLKLSQVNWQRIPECELHGIDLLDMKRGVLCLNCNAVMKRSRGRTWVCDRCKTPNMGAIEQAVADWYLLFSKTLTNKQLRYFLELKSSSAASVVFSRLQLNRIGKPPNTIYKWDYRTPLNK